jgi:uncharacterized repeat protein (TIGR02543 family)
MVGGLQFDFTALPRVISNSTMVQPFTAMTGWTNGSQTNGHIAAAGSIDANTVPAAGISGSLRMNYQWEENTQSTSNPPRRWRFHNGTANASLTNFSRANHNAVQFYLFGDGSHTRFTVVLQRQVTAGGNDTFFGRFIEIDWVGWKKITWDLTDETGLAYPWLGGSGPVPAEPLVVKGLNIEASTAGNQTWGPSTFWVSQIEALQIGDVVDFIVTFNSQGGSSVPPAFLNDGDKIPQPVDPTRAGHTFEGWYKDAAGTQAWNFDTDVVTGNMTLYAKWEVIIVEKPDNYPHPEQDPSVEAQDFYEFFHHETTSDVSWLNEGNIKRAIHRNGKLYILTHAPNPEILIKDAETLELIRKMDLTGVSGGWQGLTIRDIAFTADDKLLACNVDILNFPGTTAAVNPNAHFKVYIWDNDDAIPEVLFQFTDGGAHAGNWNNGRIGDAMAVSGPSWDVNIYISAASSSVDINTTTPNPIRIVAFTKKEGAAVVATRRHFVTANATQNSILAWGEDFQFMISPRADDRFIVTSNSVVPFELRFDWAAAIASTTLVPTAFATECDYTIFNTNGANYFRYAGRAYMVAPAADAGRVNAGVVLFDITDGLNNAVKISDRLEAEFGTDAAPYMKTFGVVANEHIYLSVMAENQGVATFATYDPNTVGINIPTQRLEVRVYPNPVQGTLYIDGDFEISSIRLIDLTGRTIMNNSTNQRSIDMSDVQAGNYILFVNDIPVKVIKK